MKLGTELLPNGKRSKAKDSWELYRRLGGFGKLWMWGYDNFTLSGPLFDMRCGKEMVGMHVQEDQSVKVHRSSSKYSSLCLTTLECEETLNLISMSILA